MAGLNEHSLISYAFVYSTRLIILLFLLFLNSYCLVSNDNLEIFYRPCIVDGNPAAVDDLGVALIRHVEACWFYYDTLDTETCEFNVCSVEGLLHCYVHYFLPIRLPPDLLFSRNLDAILILIELL